MVKRNRVACAIAVGAIVILLGSCVARCAPERGASSTPEPDRETVAEASDGTAGKDATGISGTSWSSASGETSLSFGASSVRVDAPSGSSEVPYEVTGEFDAQNATVLPGRVFLDGVWHETSFIVEGEEGSRRLNCDALDGSPFAEDPAHGFSVSGMDPGFVELVGGDSGALDAALAGWARENASGATGAAFDREAYVDYASGQVTATFTCNNPAATEVTVSYDGSTFSVWSVG